MKDILDSVGMVAGRVHNLERRDLRKPSTESGYPSKDPYGSLAANNQRLRDNINVVFGRITDCLPSLHWYKVQIDNGRVPIPCLALVQGHLGSIGASVSSPYRPGQRVYILLSDNMMEGVILGAQPSPAIDPRRCLNDQVSMGSTAGVQAEQINKIPFGLGASHGITDWSHDRPSDSITGDNTIMGDTGVGIHADSFMSYLRSDENTGVWAFYRDQQLRVAGHNYQQWSAGTEYEAFDDQGEYSSYRGETPYPWEAMGTVVPTVPYDMVDAETYQLRQPWKSSMEPIYDDQEPIHRFREYRGYLGQGRVCYGVAPSRLSAGNRGRSPIPVEGLYENRVMLDGTVAMRSAKRFLISKSPSISPPSRKRRPEDPSGDNPSNYDFSGYSGGHVVSDTPYLSSPEAPGRGRAASLPDQHAYMWNWKGPHSFHYHGRDFNLPEENQLGISNVRPNFGSLRSRSDLQEPSSRSVWIDHRYGEIPIYNSSSFFDMLDDGGIVIGDGYGSSIVMTGGHIYLNCPGDVFIGSGRNTMVWSGRNTSIRSRSDLEMSTSTGSMRLRADRHLMMASGTSGRGSILLDSRATGTAEYDVSPRSGDDWGQGMTGILFKSRTGVASWSRDLYLRTGGGDVGSGGSIILDAARGDRDIITKSASMRRYVSNGCYDYFGQDGNVRKVNSFSEGFTSLSSALSVEGIISSNDSVICSGNIFSSDGHIFTARSKDNNYYVGHLQDKSLQEVKEYISKAGEEVREDNVEDAQEYYVTFLDTPIYEQARPGHDESIRNTGFSFRSTVQYGASDFVLFDSRWQSMARASGDGSGWEEVPIQQGNQQTMPYPGYDAFISGNILHTVNPTFVDLTTGLSIPRSNGVYEEPELNDPARINLQSNYLIIG